MLVTLERSAHHTASAAQGAATSFASETSALPVMDPTVLLYFCIPVGSQDTLLFILPFLFTLTLYLPHFTSGLYILHSRFAFYFWNSSFIFNLLRLLLTLHFLLSHFHFPLHFPLSTFNFALFIIHFTF